MKVLVIGSGGREHSIVCKLKRDNVEEIYCAPGNAGTGLIAKNVNIKDDDIDSLVNFAKENSIDLTIVGPEIPLVKGIVDVFEGENLKVFGPNKMCSLLEGSKAYSKEFMIKHNIPTAKYSEYKDVNEAIENVSIYGFPVVVKADGLAAGKGVIIAENKDEAVKALLDIMKDKKFKSAGDKVIIEEFLEGVETSILAFVDENTIVPMVSAKDHKKVFNNEKGLNTGGMGTFSPSNIYTEELEEEINKKVLIPSLKGLQIDDLKFKGVLFVGLMITKEGPKVLEYNVRFGDPETQVVLNRLETPLVNIMESIINNELDKVNIKWENSASVCVVMTSKGYPNSYEKGKEITIDSDMDRDVSVIHSGTKIENGKLVTNGGRVISIVAKGKTIQEATKKAYDNIEKITFDGAHYRTDIGVK